MKQTLFAQLLRRLLPPLGWKQAILGPALEQARRDLEWETGVSRALSRLYQPLISPGATFDQMAQLVLEQSQLLTGSAAGFVLAVGRDESEQIVCATTDMRNGSVDEADGVRFSLSRCEHGRFHGLRGHALNTGKAFFTNSPHNHPSFNGYPQWHIPIRRFLAVPVILDGRPAGQIALANSLNDYGPRDLNAVGRLANFYALALQRKCEQDLMQAALEEKEVLLREIHHRVKNNLQVISSLLNLQAGSLDDPVILEMLTESQNRVRSMAMVHEQLHRSANLSRIDFREYVRNLTASLFCSYGVSSSTVSLRLEIPDVCLPIDLAVPCGLIVQELVSNALKHAFPGGRQGEICLELKPVCEENETVRYELTVRDNGVGLPEDVSPETCRSLGLRLVRILSDQINASVIQENGTGAGFRLEFPATI